MGLFQALRVHLLYMSVLLALISYIPYHIIWKQKEAALKKSVSESPFFIAHVLDPSVDGFQYTSWSRNQWATWLKSREEMHVKVNRNPGRTPLTDKPINSVLVATANEFLNAFEGRRITVTNTTMTMYNPHPGTENSNSDHTYWGEIPFSSFVFIRHGKTPRVYRCPLMYVAVKFVGEKPVHLHVHARKMDPGEKVKPLNDCVVVT